MTRNSGFQLPQKSGIIYQQRWTAPVTRPASSSTTTELGKDGGRQNQGSDDKADSSSQHECGDLASTCRLMTTAAPTVGVSAVIQAAVQTSVKGASHQARDGARNAAGGENAATAGLWWSRQAAAVIPKVTAAIASNISPRSSCCRQGSAVTTAS